MKRISISILLFAFTLVYGQEDEPYLGIDVLDQSIIIEAETDEYLNFSLSYSKKWICDTTKEFNIGKAGIIKMLYEYQLYEKYCSCNGRMEFKHVIPENGVCSMTGVFPPSESECTNQSHYEMVYITNKPTFDGFIAWLRKKYKY